MKVKHYCLLIFCIIMLISLSKKNLNKNKELICLAKDFPAPREFPLEYPGKRPSTGFILAEEKVYPIVYNNNKERVILNEKESTSINSFLKSHNVVPLEERFAIIGYGSNIVPGQLISKFGKDTVVPVFLGKIKGYDVVYNLISNMGYAFADMYKNESIEGNIGITFLDQEQFRLMLESEENYKLAYSPSNVELESGKVILGGKHSTLYIFAGFRKIWKPKGYNEPISIAELPADGRTQKPLTQTETLELVIKQFNLKEKGIQTPKELSMKIREQNLRDDRKLKEYLQDAVEKDSTSFPSFKSEVFLVEKPKYFNTHIDIE